MQETFLGNQDDNTNISMSKAPLNEVDDKIRVAKSVSESQVLVGVGCFYPTPTDQFSHI